MIAALAKQFVIDGIMHSATRQASARGAGMGLYAIAGGIGIIGVVFLAIAVYGLLLAELPMPLAAALTGLGIMILAIAIAGFGRHISTRTARENRHQESQKIEQLMTQLCDEVLTECEEPIRKNPKTALVLAGLAGLLAGDQLH